MERPAGCGEFAPHTSSQGLQPSHRLPEKENKPCRAPKKIYLVSEFRVHSCAHLKLNSDISQIISSAQQWKIFLSPNFLWTLHLHLVMIWPHMSHMCFLRLILCIHLVLCLVSHVQKSSRKLQTRVVIGVRMQLLFCYSALKRIFWLFARATSSKLIGKKL